MNIGNLIQELEHIRKTYGDVVIATRDSQGELCLFPKLEYEQTEIAIYNTIVPIQYVLIA